MNRRQLFGKLGAITAAVALAPAVKAEAAPAQRPEHEMVRAQQDAEHIALMNRIIANPEQYPEVYAEARRLQGEDALNVRGSATIDGTFIWLTRADGTTERVPATVSAWWTAPEGEQA